MLEFNTPMMKQYAHLKEQYSDCLLLFRLGDFYEMFLDDAKLGSQILNITLTSRSRGKDGRIPMAGIPYHALDSYLFKLVREGHKVAICEQITEPKKGEPLVERDVVRIVTPGTVLNESSLEQKENNYICGLCVGDKKVGLAVSDLSTGYFQTMEYDLEDITNVLTNELSKFNPSECVLPSNLYNDTKILGYLKTHSNLNIFPYMQWESHIEEATEFLTKHFGVAEIASYGLEEMNVAQKASAGLLGYLKYTQKGKINQIKKLSIMDKNDYLHLDRATISNLELFSTVREGRRKGTLINCIDKTTTPMGGRMIRDWILRPLVNKKKIEARYAGVEELLKNTKKRENLKDYLNEITDIERILSRLSAEIGGPKDLISLKYSLKKAGEIKTGLEKLDSKIFKDLSKDLSTTVLNLASYIEVIVKDEPAFDPKCGGVINDGVDTKLDKLRKKIEKSKKYISKMEITEREKTGISSLKVKFNQVFGYYIEVTKSNLDLVPDSYIRKQTLVNSERFITPDLKKHEEIILTAEEETNELEYQKFLEVVDHILNKTSKIQKTAEAIAKVDVLISFADLAKESNYTKPKIVNTGDIKIKNGRHPVVENSLETGDFVPNDTLLNQKDHQLLILTGPNMAGKSVYIRQVAIIVLLAQMGSYVPAESLEYSIVDKIFVRSGASDVISMGLSTFMVEMVETANILNNATSKSLIIMDEIGRGTSTYDGISIAWSVAEYLVANKGATPKTLFATHYHELQELENKYPDKIKNYQIAVDNTEEDPVFLHKLKPGGAEHSFGISVAKLAGVPEEVCTRAEEILNNLHNRSKMNGSKAKKDSDYKKELLNKIMKALDDEN